MRLKLDIELKIGKRVEIQCLTSEIKKLPTKFQTFISFAT